MHLHILPNMHQYYYHNEKTRQLFGRFNNQRGDIDYNLEFNSLGEVVLNHLNLLSRNTSIDTPISPNEVIDLSFTLQVTSQITNSLTDVTVNIAEDSHGDNEIDIINHDQEQGSSTHIINSYHH